MHHLMFFDPRTRAQDPDTAIKDARSEIMRRAFCRRDHATIAQLESQGAGFNLDMLYIAADFADHALVKLCLEHGVAPDEELVCRAADHKDDALVQLLFTHLPAPQDDAARAEMHAHLKRCSIDLGSATPTAN